MTQLKTNAMNFSLERCGVCDLEISFPCVCYKCGHNYHSLCINANIGDEVIDIECPKCKEGKNGLKDEIKKYKTYENNLVSLENVEKVLEEKENKIDFIYELHGKGLFNFQNIIQENK